MLLSIVSGTVSRLPYLQLMVQSVRQQLPKGIDYRFILVDGGSTDGTIAWCKQQPDIDLIQDGALLGAISAFTRGAEAAQGEYVLLANDDVSFAPYSIVTALAYLERTRECAAVAFADNRSGIAGGDPSAHRTEGIGVVLPDGTATMVPYAQVGLVRKALGDAAGWWGAHDPIMGQGRTYGGDSYLSARLWEMGYTVDAVDGCKVVELIVREYPDGTVHGDALHARHDADGHFYYDRFPSVHLPAERAVYPLPERLRALFLPIYESGYPQRANREAWLCEAFGEYGICLELDYLNARGLNLPAWVQAWQPDLILTQIQGVGEKLNADALRAMRAACPSAVVVNWNGDATLRGLVDPPILNLLRHVDLQLVVNAKALPTYQQEGIAADFWQISFKDPVDTLPSVPQWDVVYTANWYEYRRDLFDVLFSLIDYQVGVYGNERRAVGNCHHDFAMQAALYRSAKVVIGDTYPDAEGFVSNRVFQVLSQGGFLLQQYSYNLEKWNGLIDGVHYIMWNDLSDLVTKLDYWLRPEQDERRKQIAQQGQKYVRENFSASAQVRKLLTELLPKAAEKYHGEFARSDEHL